MCAFFYVCLIAVKPSNGTNQKDSAEKYINNCISNYLAHLFVTDDAVIITIPNSTQGISVSYIYII